VTGQWWLDARKPEVEAVAAHLINLAWNGLSGLEQSPTISAEAAESATAQSHTKDAGRAT
jgi:hypothetical protein